MLPPAYRADRKLLHELFSRDGRTKYRQQRLRGALVDISLVSYPSSQPKTAFIVSAKAAPLAVDRNRIKRRARAVVSKFQKSLPAGHVFIFQMNKSAITTSFEDLERDILSLLSPHLLLPTHYSLLTTHY